MSYNPNKNCLDLELRGALRRVIHGATFYESARFHGIKLEDLFSFHRSVQEASFNHFGLQASNFKLQELISTREAPESLLRFMVRRFGSSKTIRFLSSFYLLTESASRALVEKTVSAYLLPKDQFSRYLGCKVIVKKSSTKIEVYIGFGKEGSHPNSPYPFSYRCETYDDFLSALEGGYGFEIDEIVGFLSTA